jgi:hypothetical protein
MFAHHHGRDQTPAGVVQRLRLAASKTAVRVTTWQQPAVLFGIRGGTMHPAWRKASGMAEDRAALDCMAGQVSGPT